MILKASQRAGAKALAIHLLREDENDHVEVHEIRGFVADDVVGAFREAYAISKGTKCRQFLFSVSLSPPETEKVGVAAFERAIETIEQRNGLNGHPRVSGLDRLRPQHQNVDTAIGDSVGTQGQADPP